MSKHHIIYLLLIFALPAMAQKLSDTEWQAYQALNQTEQRLLDFKDSDETLRLKLTQLEVINKSRKKYKVQSVKLDILASRVANKMSKEAAENNFTGHFNLAGETPYQRYAFAGGLDHVSENAAAEWTNGKFDQSGKTVAEKMAKSHGVFMSERAPHNGHKLNCIEKNHNYVGIGVYLSEKQFRYYEEFIDRYLTFETIPTEVKKDSPFTINVSAPKGNYLYYVTAFWENTPKKLSPKQISKKGSYKDYTNIAEMKLMPWELYALKETGSTTYKIPFQFKKTGLYYVSIYLYDKELKKEAAISTKGKIQASGIVIKVTN